MKHLKLLADWIKSIFKCDDDSDDHKGLRVVRVPIRNTNRFRK